MKSPEWTEPTETARTQNPFLKATKPFEPLDTLVRTQESKRESRAHQELADSSIMKEFENLGAGSEFNTPQPYGNKFKGILTQKMTETSKKNQTPESQN